MATVAGGNFDIHDRTDRLVLADLLDEQGFSGAAAELRRVASLPADAALEGGGVDRSGTAAFWAWLAADGYPDAEEEVFDLLDTPGLVVANDHSRGGVRAYDALVRALAMADDADRVDQAVADSAQESDLMSQLDEDLPDARQEVREARLHGLVRGGNTLDDADVAWLLDRGTVLYELDDDAWSVFEAGGGDQSLAVVDQWGGYWYSRGGSWRRAGGLADLCGRLGVRYATIDDLWYNDKDHRGVHREARNGVVRVDDGQYQWYADRDEFGRAVAGLAGRAEPAGYDFYQDLCDAVRGEEPGGPLEARWNGDEDEDGDEEEGEGGEDEGDEEGD